MSKEEKVKALREELRIGRANQASANGGDPESNGGRDGHEKRTTFQDAGGSIATIAPIDLRHENGSARGNAGIASDQGGTGYDQRSPKRSIIRARPHRGRPGGSDSSTAASAETTQPVKQPEPRIIGNLEATGPTFPRTPDPPEATLSGQPETAAERRARKKREARVAARAAGKQAITLPELPKITQGKKLSVGEAKELTEPFMAAMTDNFRYLDTYLWSRQEKAGKSTHERPVWSDLDTEEVEALTRVMMRFGQHNAAAAATVRGVVEGQDYLTVGAIMVPRIGETVRIMRETSMPKQPRVRAVT